ncbi:glutaminyl-peptide cyclotransferase-like [Sycon ciliatum]|uniref:glutaminyl-peptide cyclotransferase-like n=1 Tax=Sycon ciliatum TaxID=27933 RepID=UPI0020ABED03|eukprot:scpid72916/ scgid28467/ Glutaminyl-peptide cyclotransferase; Glutaminyl cyclase; Glutaminyl-tRNA cyclotransferase
MIIVIVRHTALRRYRGVAAMYLGQCHPVRCLANWLTIISALTFQNTVMGVVTAGKPKHNVMSVSKTQKLKSLTSGLSNMDHFFKTELAPFMRVRVPGSEGLVAVRNYITSEFANNIKAPWHVEVDSFTDDTPVGNITFHNVIATLNPQAPRRLTLACHYDSKLFAPRGDGREFLGATDSAVPCAMLMELARRLDDKLMNRKKMMDVTLQLIFFDGEEAFVDWTATDSIYGSRHLAARMDNNSHVSDPDKTELDMMDALVLLDLIGSRQPPLAFYDHFDNTTHLFKQLISIEKRLRKKDLLINPKGPTYFKEQKPNERMLVEDDHIPFLRRGVPCLHLITLPFPEVWHTIHDDWTALDRATIDNISRILRVFVVEYLHLT